MFARRFEKYLNSWKNDPRRKPLVIRGARQVGKTSVVKKFAKGNYTNFVYINLDERSQLKTFEPVETLEQFTTTLSLIYGIDLKKPNTLLFIDEIQNLPNLIHLLRFFLRRNAPNSRSLRGFAFGNKNPKRGHCHAGGQSGIWLYAPFNFF